MIVIYVVLAFFCIFDIFVLVMWNKHVKKQENINKFVLESIDEIEKYAYTDIRELNDYLNKVKKHYKKLGVNDD